jgi:hypothetical protein
VRSGCQSAGRYYAVARHHQRDLRTASAAKNLTPAAKKAAAAQANRVKVIDSLTEAFALFDADDRLIMCNHQYAQHFTHFNWYENIAGISFEDLVRLSLAKGEVIEPSFRDYEEGGIRKRIQHHRNPPDEPHELQLSQGRWLEIGEQRQTMEYAVTALLANAKTLNNASPKIFQIICTMLGADDGAF